MDKKVTLESVDKKIDGLDSKVEIYRQAIVGRFDSMDSRFDALESRFDAFELRFDAFELKIDSRFDELTGVLLRGFASMKQNPYSDLLND